jgi:NAD-dependent SIR2 family protein deacetylase
MGSFQRVRCPVCGKLSPDSYFTGEARAIEVKVCRSNGRSFSWDEGSLTRVIAVRLRDAAAAAARRLDEMLG